jgi:hypothetical protein
MALLENGYSVADDSVNDNASVSLIGIEYLFD